MMKDLIIIGASGFGRETAWIVERINHVNPTWNLLGFVDDNESIWGQTINKYNVIGGCSKIADYPDAYFVCAVGASKTRKTIIEKVITITPNIKFATLLDPSVLLSEFVSVGAGSIICAHTIITVNVTIGNHVIINLDCTIGHDAVLEDYVTLYPSVNISGLTTTGLCTEIGTGSQVIQGKTIGCHSIVGAGSVVIKDIPDKCTAVGSPAKPIKFFE